MINHDRIFGPGGTGAHKIKKRGKMNQPAEGYYVDCVCGRTGALRKTKELALEDYMSHLPK